eukprot:m.207472 g.207472  ORF g.207472 m.207472 type:complete len:249 (+) comp39694_c1_seq52:1227-1973(+)
MLPVTLCLSDGSYDERFLLLFASNVVILTVSSTLNGYCLEKKFPISEVNLKSVSVDSNSLEVEMTAGSQKYLFHCSSADDKDSLMTNWEVFTNSMSIFGHGLRRPSASTVSPASPYFKSHFSITQTPTGLNAVAAKLFNRKKKGNQSSASSSSLHIPMSRPKYWGFRSLRPAPPAKTNILPFKEDHGPKSPRAFLKKKGVKKGGKSKKEDRYKKKQKQINNNNHNSSLVVTIVTTERAKCGTPALATS